MAVAFISTLAVETSQLPQSLAPRRFPLLLVQGTATVRPRGVLR